MAIIHFRCKERRRTVRVMLTVPLRVSGKTEIGEKFSVRAMSHSVSLHGASVELEQGVVLGLTQSLNSIAAIAAPAIGGLLIDHSLLSAWAWLAAGISAAALLL